MDISLFNLLLQTPSTAAGAVSPVGTAPLVQNAQGETVDAATLFQSLLDQSATASKSLVDTSATQDLLVSGAALPVTVPIVPEINADVQATPLVSKHAPSLIDLMFAAILPSQEEKEKNPVALLPQGKKQTIQEAEKLTPAIETGKIVPATNTNVPQIDIAVAPAAVEAAQKIEPLPALPQDTPLPQFLPIIPVSTEKKKEAMDTASLLPVESAAKTMLPLPVAGDETAPQEVKKNISSESAALALLAMPMVAEDKKSDLKTAKVTSVSTQPDAAKITPAQDELSAIVLNSQIALTAPKLSTVKQSAKTEAIADSSALKSVQLASSLLQKGSGNNNKSQMPSANEIFVARPTVSNAVSAQEVSNSLAAAQPVNNASLVTGHEKIIAPVTSTVWHAQTHAPVDAARTLTHVPVVEQVLVQLKSAPKGDSHIRIQLDPAELGRVDVQMDVNKEGKTNVTVIADNKNTLDLLQKDAALLQRALNDAGLKADSGSLSFNLRGGNQQQAWQDSRYTAFHVPAGYDAVADTPIENETPIIALARHYTAAATAGLNITV